MRNILASLLLMGGIGAAAAQEFPSRQVRVFVPVQPGGITDILARVIGQSLSQTWKQTVIVENRPGADEMLAAEAVAKSAPDGHTLLVTSNGPITSAPHIHKDMRYDPLRDLTPLVMLASATPVVNVPAASPVKSVRDLVDLARQKPGVLNYGSMGNGTYPHLAMEDFKQRTGTDLQHVPYRGSNTAITALLQNEITVLIVNLSNVAEFEKAGSVRVIASAGARRAAIRPELPTVDESGVPGFSTGNWWGLFGPANMPPAAAAKIRADVLAVLTGPEAKRLFETNTLEPVVLDPADYARFLREDFDRMGVQIRAAGVKAE